MSQARARRFSPIFSATVIPDTVEPLVSATGEDYTRNIRALFRARGWVNETIDNIPLVKHPELGLMVGYQSVDVAASDFQSPKAISGKGAGAERAIDEAQGSLFALPEGEPDTHVRSEERRVGKEWVRTGRSRGST